MRKKWTSHCSKCALDSFFFQRLPIVKDLLPIHCQGFVLLVERGELEKCAFCNHSPGLFILNHISCNVKCKQLGSSMTKKKLFQQKMSKFFIWPMHTHPTNRQLRVALLIIKRALKTEFFFYLYFIAVEVSLTLLPQQHIQQGKGFFFINLHLKKKNSSEVSVIVGFQAENLTRFLREL